MYGCVCVCVSFTAFVVSGIWCGGAGAVGGTQVEHGGTEETINVGAFSSADGDMTQTDGTIRSVGAPPPCKCGCVHHRLLL